MRSATSFRVTLSRCSIRLYCMSQRRAGSVLLAGSFEQRFHDAQPFRIERLPANGLACASVPVSCIALIPFFAVRVGMNPRTFDTFVLLGGFVRLCPIAFGVKPQSGEGVRESGWRLACCEGSTKVVQGHREYAISVRSLKEHHSPREPHHTVPLRLPLQL